jgi:hypothetical protein
MADLKSEFAAFEVAPNQTQYAAALINGTSSAFLWPVPTPNNILGTNGPRNWVYGYGTPGTDGHAEATIAAALPTLIAAYPAAFADPVSHAPAPVTRVALYSYYSPCNQCTIRILSALPAGVRLDFGFTEQWGADDNAFNAIRRLQDAHTHIYRVCAPGEDCQTFQRALHTCAMSKPIICIHCQDRAQGIAGFINRTMDTVKSKAMAAWQEAIGANHSNLEVQAESVAAWDDCLKRAQIYPVTGHIGVADEADPTGAGMPANWNQLSPPSPNCGPVAFDPRSGRFTGCSPKATKRPG